ncbi:hypothetical protein EHP00_1347 [Ecytonucleospora hepatopenaei]|uniref:Uncharacterized protein n=1 Tax=Ecytonucleospora hepatopenaei TaxID=646526 RepID=A0A1W0E706_9MICR|nr:hypothetical protein EHP00_1347 [Ecytonucleospora hepatopenaei]
MKVNVLDLTLAQDCSFILFQYVSILKNDKNFNRKEISGKIIPFYVYSTLFWIPFVYTSVITINVYWFLLLMATIPLIVLFFVLLAPKYRETNPNNLEKKVITKNDDLNDKKENNNDKINNDEVINININQKSHVKENKLKQNISLAMVRLAYILGSFGELVRQLQRNVLTASGKNAKGSDSVLLKLKSESIKSFSAWVAQDLFTLTEQYAEIYMFSIILNSVLICVAAAGDSMSSRAKKLTLMEILKGVSTGFKSLNSKQAVNLAASITNSTLRLFLGLFSNSILLEIHSKTLENRLNHKNECNEENRKKTFKEKCYDVLQKINACFSFLITCITRSILFVTRTPIVKNKKSYLGIGYIVGIVKLMSTLTAYLISKLLEKNKVSGYYATFYIFPILFLVFMLFVRSKTVLIANVFFFTTSTVMGVLDGCLKETYITIKNKELITCFSLFVTGAISSSINGICSYSDFGVKTKCYIFISLGIFSYTLFFLVSLIKV